MDKEFSTNIKTNSPLEIRRKLVGIRHTIIINICFVLLIVNFLNYMYKLGYKEGLKELKKEEMSISLKKTPPELTANITKVAFANDKNRPSFIKDSFNDSDILVWVQTGKKNMDEDEITNLIYELPRLQLISNKQTSLIYRTEGFYYDQNELVLLASTKDSKAREAVFKIIPVDTQGAMGRWVIGENITLGSENKN